MSLSNIYSIYRTMEEENILLSFKGIVTSDLLTTVLNIMENKMQTLQESSVIKKKVFNVLVECIQNLYHHAEQNLDDLNASRAILEKQSAIVLVVYDGNEFMIRTGNYIENRKVNELKERLNTINSMNSEELKFFYQERLSASTISSKGTAGLGMIDIARKSGNKLEFEFLKINEQTSFFCLNVKID